MEFVSNPANNTDYEQAVHAYAAVRAVAADLTPQHYRMADAEIAEFNRALDELGRYLASECFKSTADLSHTPTAYDSPPRLNLEKLGERAKRVVGAIQPLKIVATSARLP